MVRMLTSSAADRGFLPRSGRPKTIKLVVAAKPTALRRKRKDGLAQNQENGATCLSEDCCFSDLVLLKSN
jgi:hypothetical protein